jgi:hypothetical protein
MAFPLFIVCFFPALMVVMLCSRPAGRSALQEFFFLSFFFLSFFFLSFFFRIVRAFRIELFHRFNFPGRERRRMTDEMNQFPRVLLAMFGTAPGGHAAQTNTVFDYEEDLSVRLLPSRCFPHIWRRRVHLPSHRYLATHVVRMACGTVRRPMRTGVGNDPVGHRYWVSHLPRVGRER